MKKVRYAGFLVRAVASVIDLFLLALPLAVFVQIISGGAWFDFESYIKSLQLASQGDPRALVLQRQSTSTGWEIVFEVLTLVVTVIFWERWKGATPGKKIMGIKIVDNKIFEDITNKQAVIRSLGYIPSALFFGMGFFMVAFRKDKRAFHDLLANTAVIYEEKNNG